MRGTRSCSRRPRRSSPRRSRRREYAASGHGGVLGIAEKAVRETDPGRQAPRPAAAQRTGDRSQRMAVLPRAHGARDLPARTRTRPLVTPFSHLRVRRGLTNHGRIQQEVMLEGGGGPTHAPLAGGNGPADPWGTRPSRDWPRLPRREIGGLDLATGLGVPVHDRSGLRKSSSQTFEAFFFFVVASVGGRR